MIQTSLTTILGSGKTSLLDAIACQTAGHVTGECRINGAERTPAMIKSCSAYVRQNDRLLPHLSVRDTLLFVAQLKLPRDWSKQRVEDRVRGEVAFGRNTGAPVGWLEGCGAINTSRVFIQSPNMCFMYVIDSEGGQRDIRIRLTSRGQE